MAFEGLSDALAELPDLIEEAFATLGTSATVSYLATEGDYDTEAGQRTGAVPATAATLCMPFKDDRVQVINGVPRRTAGTAIQPFGGTPTPHTTILMVQGTSWMVKAYSPVMVGANVLAWNLELEAVAP